MNKNGLLVPECHFRSNEDKLRCKCDAWNYISIPSESEETPEASDNEVIGSETESESPVT